MVINIKLTTVATLICAATVSCNGCKDILGCESSYKFQLDCRVSPNKDTISRGDTVWIQISSPVVFTDQISGEQIDYSNASNLGTDIGFQKLISSAPVQVANAVSDFNFVLRTGIEINSSNPEGDKNYLINEVSNKYVFNLGIIAKDTGTFRFFLSSSVNVEQSGKPCPKADFDIIMVQTNQHYYLYPGMDSVSTASSNYLFYVKQ